MAVLNKVQNISWAIKYSEYVKLRKKGLKKQSKLFLAEFLKEFTRQSNDELRDNNFSNADKWSNIKKKMDGYLTTPNGSLKKYDYKTREQTTISTDLPSDPNDTTRQNKIDPVNLPKDEPKVDLRLKK